MENNKNEGLFGKYVMMIRKRAHEYSKQYGIDYEELEAQGYLIYCECLEKYDFSKAQFGTYLFIQLNRIRDYAKTYNRQKGIELTEYLSKNKVIENPTERDSLEEQLPAREEQASLFEVLGKAKEFLSMDAYEVFEWILGRSWEKKGKRKPTVSMASKYFNITKEVAEKLWEEIRNFWMSEGYKVYA